MLLLGPSSTSSIVEYKVSNIIIGGNIERPYIFQSKADLNSDVTYIMNARKYCP